MKSDSEYPVMRKNAAGCDAMAAAPKAVIENGKRQRSQNKKK